MFNELLKKAEKASYGEKSKLAWKIFWMVILIETATVICSGGVSVMLATLLQNEEAGIFSFCLLVPVLSALAFWKTDKVTAESHANARMPEPEEETPDVWGYGKMPHFRDMYKRKQFEDIISDMSFHPYKNKWGKEIPYIKMSDDDKWVRILGSIYPVDLIVGYNKKENELYAIDGTVIKLPVRGRLPFLSESIEKFFEDRGDYYTELPKKSNARFKAALGRPLDELSKADWGKVRYQWEKYNAGEAVITGDGRDIFERVLTEAEVNKYARAIRQGKVKLTDYMCFKGYENEYSVCNGIRLLKVVDSHLKHNGLDFLFDCLNDVDEAYFQMAVDALKTYPKDKVKAKLEENAKKAFEKGNVQGLGGLLYLAKTLGYEIQYVRDLKKAQAEAEESLKNSQVPSFEVDEAAMFGSGEIQEFSPYAYKRAD